MPFHIPHLTLAIRIRPPPPLYVSYDAPEHKRNADARLFTTPRSPRTQGSLDNCNLDKRSIVNVRRISRCKEQTLHQIPLRAEEYPNGPYIDESCVFVIIKYSRLCHNP
ncbi:hypothetical protein PTI98_011516 [Pleurotus ostreatus]|nr:hypothetical protein PTI98_011516 [Pleurotus ostreatus]